MEREFSAPLHHTQFENHLKYKTRAARVNPELKKLLDSGVSMRTAYRMLEATKTHKARKDRFDYDAHTPKGEWV